MKVTKTAASVTLENNLGGEARNPLGSWKLKKKSLQTYLLRKFGITWRVSLVFSWLRFIVPSTDCKIKYFMVKWPNLNWTSTRKERDNLPKEPKRIINLFWIRLVVKRRRKMDSYLKLFHQFLQPAGRSGSGGFIFRLAATASRRACSQATVSKVLLPARLFRIRTSFLKAAPRNEI